MNVTNRHLLAREWTTAFEVKPLSALVATNQPTNQRFEGGDLREARRRLSACTAILELTGSLWSVIETEMCNRGYAYADFLRK